MALPWKRCIFPRPYPRSMSLSPGVSPRHTARLLSTRSFREPFSCSRVSSGVCAFPLYCVGPSPRRRSASVPEFLGAQGVSPYFTYTERRVPAFVCPPPRAVYLAPQVLASTTCVLPPYAELLCPSPCRCAVAMCYLPTADGSSPRYSAFVTGTLHPLPSPVTDSAVISILSLVLPSLLGTENARKPAGAVGKSRSGGAAQVGLRLPRPCRQGPPACPPPNTPAPGRSGTAASATLPGPAQLSLAAASADGS